MDPFPKRSDDMIQLRTGPKLKMPSIDPQWLPLCEITCGACNTRWGTRALERKSDLIERPFMLPCQHLVGSVCLATLLAEKSPRCPTCLVSVDYEVHINPQNDQVVETDDTNGDRESSLSSVPQSPTWPGDSEQTTLPASPQVGLKLASGGRPTCDPRMKIDSIINKTASETRPSKAASTFSTLAILEGQRQLPAADHGPRRTTASGPPNTTRDEKLAMETQMHDGPRSGLRRQGNGVPLYNTRYHPMDPYVKRARRVSGPKSRECSR